MGAATWRIVRRRCSRCGRHFAVRADGMIRFHRWEAAPCPGSWTDETTILTPELRQAVDDLRHERSAR